jgi:hypothetical protein
MQGNAHQDFGKLTENEIGTFHIAYNKKKSG